MLLDDDTVFDDVLPIDASGVHAQYYRYPAKKPTVKVLSSLMDPESFDTDEPTGNFAKLEDAEDFMYDVLEYVHEDKLDTSLRVGHPIQVPRVTDTILHAFELEMSPLLPLSGKEDRDFLSIYHQQMLQRLGKAHEQLSQIEATGITSGKLHENFAGRVAAYRKAAERASRFL